MKKYSVLLLLIFCAATIVDQTNQDFQQGHLINVHVTNNTVLLAQNINGFVTQGTYTSRVRDLGSNPSANISWDAHIPPNTAFIITTRTGPTSAVSSQWTSFQAPHTNAEGSVIQNPQRYVQYRIQLSTTVTSVSPILHSVTIRLEEAGTQIGPVHQQNVPLTSLSTGEYRFYLYINDTVLIESADVRYRFGNQPFTVFQPLIQNQNIYHAVVPEPQEGWRNVSNQNLELEIRVLNAQGVQIEETYIVPIEYINRPPILQPIPQQAILEGEELRLLIFAEDEDGDELTFSTSHGTITQLSNTIAELVWTPQSQHVGQTAVTITVTDGTTQALTSFPVTVQRVNKPPRIRPIGNKTGYVGERLVFDIIVDDDDIGDVHTYTVLPSWFRPVILTIQAEPTVYRARVNFTLFDTHRGTNDIRIIVQDQEGLQDTTQFSLTVGYCGDRICQEQETRESCPQDCAGELPKPYLAIEFERRICVGEETTITVYNASSRYICFADGRVVQDAAICQQAAGAEVVIREMDGVAMQEVLRRTTDDRGAVYFTPQREGRYQAIATYQNAHEAREIFTARECIDPILEERVIIAPRPELTVTPRPQGAPRTERPQLLPEENNALVGILLFYVLAPLLLAGTVYLYATNKQESIFFLKIQIRYLELRKQTDRYWLPYVKKIYAPIQPVMQRLHEILIKPIQGLFKK